MRDARSTGTSPVALGISLNVSVFFPSFRAGPPFPFADVLTASHDLFLFGRLFMPPSISNRVGHL
jgi:hypothetical protein